MEKRVFEPYIRGKREQRKTKITMGWNSEGGFWINGEGNQIGSKTDRSFMLL